MASHPAADRITARRIQELLSPATHISRRRIQEYMRSLRAESSASRL
jgi:hypothetical protein